MVPKILKPSELAERAAQELEEAKAASRAAAREAAANAAKSHSTAKHIKGLDGPGQFSGEGSLSRPGTAVSDAVPSVVGGESAFTEATADIERRLAAIRAASGSVGAVFSEADMKRTPLPRITSPELLGMRYACEMGSSIDHHTLMVASQQTSLYATEVRQLAHVNLNPLVTPSGLLKVCTARRTSLGVAPTEVNTMLLV